MRELTARQSVFPASGKKMHQSMGTTADKEFTFANNPYLGYGQLRDLRCSYKCSAWVPWWQIRSPGSTFDAGGKKKAGLNSKTGLF